MRFISKKDCGSFLYDSCRIPYLTGCKFPIAASDSNYTDFNISSRIAGLFNQMGILLQICHKKIPASPIMDLYFSSAEHLEFFEILTEASTLYLLEGPPIEAGTQNRSEFISRLSRSGHGIVLPCSFRESIRDFTDFIRHKKESSSCSVMQ